MVSRGFRCRVLRSRRLTLGWSVVILGMAVLATCLGTPDSAVWAADSADKIQKHYPFFPSAQTTPDGKPVSLKDYAKNADCISCHKKIGEQWKGSMHAAAAVDPVFLALSKLGSQQTDKLTDNLCVGCHSSPAVVSGQSSPGGLAKLDPPAPEGVSCVVCHSISGLNVADPDDPPHNASFVTDPKGPIVGPHSNRPCRQEGKDTVKKAFLSKSEFCATCHGVVHPLNGFVVERTYDEWRGSIYATKGIQCQDCHMRPIGEAVGTALSLKKVPSPGRAADKGPRRDHVYSHHFVGGNAVLCKLLGNEEHSEMAEMLLKSAASLELQMPENASAGSVVQLRVKVNNETAGHNLPTSLVEVRQMWLDVQVTDASGKELYRSGDICDKGDIDPDAVMFHGVAADADGNPTVLPWAMERFLYFHTVPPRGYTLERYAFQIPQGTKGPVKVKATLRYRSFPQKVANLLLGEGAPTIPVIDMTSEEVSLKVSGK